MPKLVLVLTATLRTDPLVQAIRSLTQFVLPHWQVVGVGINVDPAFGAPGVHQDRAYTDVIWLLTNATRHSFLDLQAGSSLLLHRSDRASHARAIDRLWTWAADVALSNSATILHWEDDQVALHDITPDLVLPLLAGVGQVQVGSEHPGEYRVGRDGMPAMGTSPRFLSHGFARQFARLLNLDSCPEKQWSPRHRSSGQERFLGWDRARCRILRHPAHPGQPSLRHVGEEWASEWGYRRRVEGPRLIRMGPNGEVFG